MCQSCSVTGPRTSHAGSGGRPSTIHEPGSDGFPAADGWYAPTTTWREIIKAATEVDRDVTPHLQNQPRYAHGELVARVSPLHAHLGAHPVRPRHPLPGVPRAGARP